MFKIHLNIGSNQGCRRDNIERAAPLVERLDEIVSSRRSELVESEPWGYESDSRYLNVGMLVESTVTPDRLLDRLQTIQQSIDPVRHRNADGSYADRVLDIDIIAAYDAVSGEPFVCETETLTLPHPRMHLRCFVLLPLATLDPHWHHPLLGLTAEQLLVNLLLKQAPKS